MATKAKFRCDGKSVQEYGGDNCFRQVNFTPVYDSNPESENGRFYKSTPSGKLELGGVSEEIYNGFEPGKQYFLTIEEA